MLYNAPLFPFYANKIHLRRYFARYAILSNFKQLSKFKHYLLLSTDACSNNEFAFNNTCNILKCAFIKLTVHAIFKRLSGDVSLATEKYPLTPKNPITLSLL